MKHTDRSISGLPKWQTFDSSSLAKRKGHWLIFQCCLVPFPFMAFLSIYHFSSLCALLYLLEPLFLVNSLVFLLLFFYTVVCYMLICLLVLSILPCNIFIYLLTRFLSVRNINMLSYIFITDSSRCLSPYIFCSFFYTNFRFPFTHNTFGTLHIQNFHVTPYIFSLTH